MHSWVFQNNSYVTNPMTLFSRKTVMNEYICDYVRKNDKTGGQKAHGNLTGIYHAKNSNNGFILFKQGRNDGETISEFLASKLYNLIIPGYAAQTFLACEKPSTKTRICKGNLHPNIYIGSKFFEEYIEIHKLMHFKKSRPLFMQTLHRQIAHKWVHKVGIHHNLQDIIASALWLGDYDTHIANIGIARFGNEQDKHYKFVKIDHGWSFAHLQENMNLSKTPWSGFDAIGKPTNHFLDYDYDGFYQSDKFKDAIRNIKTIEKNSIEMELNIALEYVSTLYSSCAFQSLAKWIGYKNFPSNGHYSKIVSYLTEKLYKRAQSPVILKKGILDVKPFVTKDNINKVAGIHKIRVAGMKTPRTHLDGSVAKPVGIPNPPQLPNSTSGRMNRRHA